jgi:hypothetical protein
MDNSDFSAFNFCILGVNRVFHTIYHLSNNIDNLIAAAHAGVNIIPLANCENSH